MAEETRMTMRSDLPARRDERSENTAQLRAEIEQSRAAMSDTLSQIQERLRPARLKAQAKEKVREATIGRVKEMANKVGDRAGQTGRSIVDVAKENPVPLALIGIGAGLLFMNSRRRGREISGGYQASETPEQAREELKNAARNVEHRVADTARNVEHRVADAAHEVGHKVADTARNVEHKVAETASSVAHSVENAARNLAGNTRRQALKAQYHYQESPWMGAAMAVALGAAAGLVLPTTDRERELMGEKRDQLFDRVSELGREKLNAARNVVSEVAQDAKEAVRESVQTHAREEGLVDTGETTDARSFS
jgi:hypothetical protein